MAQRSTVPVLVDRGSIVQSSDHIFDYLDEHYPDTSLTPADPHERDEALEWESYFDRELGETTRRILYFHGLPDRRFIVPLYTVGGPWWCRPFYALGGYTVVRNAIRRMYKITPSRVESDVERVHAVFARVDEHLKTHRYLVGDEFSRADLTLAALGALIARPDNHPFRFFPLDSYPPALLDLLDRFSTTSTAQRIRQLYRDHRCAPRAARPRGQLGAFR